MPNSPLRLATRGSALARWQTHHVATQLPVPSREVVIETRGDVDQSPILAGKLEKGFFTEELERALRAHEVDVAVHSLKDLPTTQPAGLCLGAILNRADARDLLLVHPEAYRPSGGPGLPLRDGARVGASSLRRMALLRHHAPTASAVPLRGNVPTRLSKLSAHTDYDAIVLAAAGLLRLGLDLTAFHVVALNPKVWVPAPGQGAIAVQCREDDAATRDVLAAIDDTDTRHRVEAERTLLRAFEGGCSSPFGAYAPNAETVHVGLERDGRWLHASCALGEETLPLTVGRSVQLLAALPFHVPTTDERHDLLEKF